MFRLFTGDKNKFQDQKLSCTFKPTKSADILPLHIGAKKSDKKVFFITYTIIRHYSQILSESFELLCDESSQEEWLSKRHEHWKRPRKRKKKATDIADLVNLTGKW